MRKKPVVVALGVFVLSFAFAQQPNVEQYVTRVEGGDADAVRAELPALQQKYPNDPGVLYLQALLTTDGAEAVRLYQKLVDTYPNSDWADDALYKVYKFYYAIGLYRTAELKLDQLRTRYPNSRYVTGSRTEAENSSPEPVQKTETVSTLPPHERTDTTATAPSPQGDVPPVVEQRPHPAAEPPRTVTEPKGTELFTLQVGAFSTAANANRQKAFLDFHNYPADVASKTRDGKSLYVVYVGRFTTEEQARRTGEELKRSFNIKYIIVKR